MNVAYIAKSMIPSESANSIHVMKISEAFSKLVDNFCLVIPQCESKTGGVKESFSYYDVEKFEIRCVKTDLKNGLKSRYLFPWKAVLKAINQKADVIVTRDPIVAFLTVCFHRHAILDLHGEIKHLCGRAYRMIKFKWFIRSKYLHLVMISKGLCTYYHEKYNLPIECMTVLPDGYTEKNFEKDNKHPILQNESISIAYCGGFLLGKGIGIILQMAQRDKKNIYHMYGGNREKAEKEVGKKFPDNVEFKGYIPNSQVPKTLDKYDVLLLPNQEYQVCKGEDIGKVTSPLKMFEYMASEKVIIASDIPVLREVLNEQNSYLVRADDPMKWVEALEYINLHREEAASKAKKAGNQVKQYSWSVRAKRMLDLVQNEK